MTLAVEKIILRGEWQALTQAQRDQLWRTAAHGRPYSRRDPRPRRTLTARGLLDVDGQLTLWGEAVLWATKDMR